MRASDHRLSDMRSTPRTKHFKAKGKVGARPDLLTGSIQTCADRGGQKNKPAGEDSQ